MIQDDSLRSRLNLALLLTLPIAFVILGCSYKVPYRPTNWSSYRMAGLASGKIAMKCEDVSSYKGPVKICVGINSGTKRGSIITVDFKVTLENQGDKVQSLSLSDARIRIAGVDIPPVDWTSIRDVYPGAKGSCLTSFLVTQEALETTDGMTLMMDYIGEVLKFEFVKM